MQPSKGPSYQGLTSLLSVANRPREKAGEEVIGSALYQRKGLHRNSAGMSKPPGLNLDQTACV